jgi:hypothetical protein
LGDRTLEGFSRENEDLREVAKSSFIPNRWIWKGTWHRSTYLKGGTLRRKAKRLPMELRAEVNLGRRKERDTWNQDWQIAGSQVKERGVGRREDSQIPNS